MVKVAEPCGTDRKNMGMFYLKNADARTMDVFPQDVEEIRFAWTSPARKGRAPRRIAHSSTLVTHGTWIR